MKVLITGADGFVGRNLVAHLNEMPDIEVVKFGRGDDVSSLHTQLPQLDFIFHLAGVNRPLCQSDFTAGNVDLTASLCEAVSTVKRDIPILYTSSTQACLDNAYGISKNKAEEVLATHARETQSTVFIYRLPNVFGKWSRPNYNSAIATFCHNIARDLPITVNDPGATLDLVYIDDVVEAFVGVMRSTVKGLHQLSIDTRYKTTVGAVAEQIQAFKDSRENLITEKVGTGLCRALYSTYLSFIPTDKFSYGVPKHEDPRGAFVEVLKTKDSGQFSYFTAHPGIVRGGHYHHSKTEKFLVVRGQACFRFRHIVTNEYYELFTDGAVPQIVETVPGWTHDIVNIGPEEMLVMLWANEIFDRSRPDTFASKTII